MTYQDKINCYNLLHIQVKVINFSNIQSQFAKPVFTVKHDA